MDGTLKASSELSNADKHDFMEFLITLWLSLLFLILQNTSICCIEGIVNSAKEQIDKLRQQVKAKLRTMDGLSVHMQSHTNHHGCTHTIMHAYMHAC